MALGRKSLGKLFFAAPGCTSCKKCAQVCPKKAIKMRGKKPRWTWKCKGCLRCYALCPVRKVETSLIRLVGMLVLLFLPYDDWFWALIHYDPKKLGFLFCTILGLVVWSLGYLITLWVADKLAYLFEFLPGVKRLTQVKWVVSLRNKLSLSQFVFNAQSPVGKRGH